MMNQVKLKLLMKLSHLNGKDEYESVIMNGNHESWICSSWVYYNNEYAKHLGNGILSKETAIVIDNYTQIE